MNHKAEKITWIPPSRPGASLKSHMQAVGLNDAKFSERSGIPVEELRAITSGEGRIDEAKAAQISKILGTSVELWINLQLGYDQGMVKHELLRVLCEGPSIPARLRAFDALREKLGSAAGASFAIVADALVELLLNATHKRHDAILDTLKSISPPFSEEARRQSLELLEEGLARPDVANSALLREAQALIKAHSTLKVP